jgi:hypothetical protein
MSVTVMAYSTPMCPDEPHGMSTLSTLALVLKTRPRKRRKRSRRVGSHLSIVPKRTRRLPLGTLVRVSLRGDGVFGQTPDMMCSDRETVDDGSGVSKARSLAVWGGIRLGGT